MNKIFFLFILNLILPLQIFSQVETAWIRRFNSAGNNNTDWASALAVDSSGNVYVTGNSGTLKYSANGDSLWFGVFGGTDLAVDNSGNVYVTGSGGDHMTIKYSPDGDTLWVRSYIGPGVNFFQANALAVDGYGNSYVCGYSAGSSTGIDYCTIKYSPAGDTLWVRNYNGPGDYYDNAMALAIDSSGNVCVTGYSVGSGTIDDYATIKYSSAGDTLWVRRYNGPANSYELADAIAVDDSGNVYVTGASQASNGYVDYATIKYSPAGDTLWIRRYDGPANGYDFPSAIALDDNGNLYVTGSSMGMGTYIDYSSVKYSPSGDALWVRRYSGPGSGEDAAAAIAVDSAGNVYVTGKSEGSTWYDYATIKYSSVGGSLWVSRYSAPGDGGDIPSAIVIDDNGNVYLTGVDSLHWDYNNENYVGGAYGTIKYAQQISCCLGMRGDVNYDGTDANMLDLTYLVDRIFRGGPIPACPNEADVNSDGASANILDLTFLVDRIFRVGQAPGACI